MKIRPADLSDLPAVCEIYDNARAYMRENGNPNQWINGYPQPELVERDIRSGISYVCCQEEKVLAVFCFLPGPDPSYLEISQGEWLDQEPYWVVHRIASGSHQKGVASFCIDWCFQQQPNIRIDTHRDNHVMQSFLKKKGFSYCGIIHLQESGAERLAFQRHDPS